MIATLLDNGFLVSGIMAASASVGIIVGRGTRAMLQARAARRKEDALIKMAVVGKPADEFGPREPGLIEMMRDLRAEFDAHVKEHNARPHR